MKKLLSAVMAGILSVAVVGCAQTSKTASDVSSVSSISSTVSSDTSSVAESSELMSSAPTSSAPVSSQAASSQAVSSKTVSSKAAVTRTAAEPASSAPSSPASSTPASSAPDDIQQKIDVENARHTAALAALKTGYDKNVAILDEISVYNQKRNEVMNALVGETDETKISELTKTKEDYQVLILKDYMKVTPILYPALKDVKSNFYMTYSEYFKKIGKPWNVDSFKREFTEKYNNDIAAENDKHDEIMKQLS